MDVGRLREAEGLLGGMEVTDRAALLLEGLEVVESHCDELVTLAESETGKLPGDLSWELEESVAFGRELASRAAAWLASSELDTGDPSTSASLLWEPLGACLAIKPYNYPIELPMWTIASNILAGNPVVLKPSEHAGQVGARLASLVEDGTGKLGLVQAVIGGPEAAIELLETGAFRVVSFTGSNAGARAVASAVDHLSTLLVIEGQGADLAVVLDTAILDYALPGIAWGAFFGLGLVCVATKQILVPEGTEHGVAARLAGAVRLAGGNLPSPESLLPRVREAYQQQVRALAQLGCRFLTPGADDVTPDELCSRDAGSPVIAVAPPATAVSNTAFGPVTVVRPYSNLEEASDIVSASDFGLGLSIWGSDMSQALEFARKRHVGMTWINDVNLAGASVPWLGGRGSGIGAELGELGLRTYSRPRVVYSRDAQAGPREYWFHESSAEGGE